MLVVEVADVGGWMGGVGWMGGSEYAERRRDAPSRVLGRMRAEAPLLPNVVPDVGISRACREDK